MTKEDKKKVFSFMLENFETEEFKEYFMDMCGEIPSYIYSIPASTSRLYHSKQQCVRYGQIFHEYMFFSILNHRLRLKMNREKFNTPEVRDAMRCVPVFHDAIKCGLNGSQYTVQDHPMLAAQWVRETKVEHDIPEEYKEMIAGMCEAHSGEWNKSRSGKEIMPEPRNDMEFFIHECDILSSRSDLEWDIPEDLLVVLKAVNPEPTLETYILDFGKYKGLSILEVLQEDPEYVAWSAENVKKEPAKTLYKEALNRKEEEDLIFG